MQNQNTDRTQNTVIPKVRYHPSIQTPGTRTRETPKTRPAAGYGVRMQNQNTDRTQNTVIPKVRYHPSIQTPGTKETPKTAPAAGRPPQEDQRTRQTPEPDGRQQEPVDRPVQRAATGPSPDRAPPTPDRAPPTPKQVPVGVAVQVDRGLVEEVELLTRGQRTNPAWFSWRRNRITASVAHSIAYCRFVNGKSKTPPTSYLAAITGEGRSLQTRAVSWGVRMEAEAVRRYQRLKTAQLARPVSVRDCGLFVDPRRPWLAASPDGIVTDGRTGQRLLCLEVKCPYKHRDRRLDEACRLDPNFCLQRQDQDGQSPSYRLKTSHRYFTQVQVQLAVTGLRRADLAVFTLKETAVVPVTFDPVLWEETLSKLETFYRDAVLPHLRQTWTHEP